MIAGAIIPFGPETLLDEVAKLASANQLRGMHLISDGFKVVVSPIVPAGFFKIGIKTKNSATFCTKEATCAA